MNITICSSAKFYAEIEAARQELAARGHVVKIPEVAAELPPMLT